MSSTEKNPSILPGLTILHTKQESKSFVAQKVHAIRRLRGTAQGNGTTWIGDRNMFMIGSHVGHDARIGNGCTVVNYALVAGHVILDDGCILSGHTAVQQRVRVGRLAMLGGMAATSKDIPPFVLQQGYNCVTGLNVVGLRRSGCAPEAIDALRQTFRIFYREGRTLGGALDQIEADLGSVAEVAEFVRFIRQSKIGINPARGPERAQRNLKAWLKPGSESRVRRLGSPQVTPASLTPARS